MICSSENLLLRIVRLLSGGYGLYPNLEEIERLKSTAIWSHPCVAFTDAEKTFVSVTSSRASGVTLKSVRRQKIP